MRLCSWCHIELLFPIKLSLEIVQGGCACSRTQLYFIIISDALVLINLIVSCSAMMTAPKLVQIKFQINLVGNAEFLFNSLRIPTGYRSDWANQRVPCEKKLSHNVICDFDMLTSNSSVMASSHQPIFSTISTISVISVRRRQRISDATTWTDRRS